jgi:cytochrome P450
MTTQLPRPHAPFEIIDPAYYAANGYPHDIFTELRERAPVAWCDAPGFEPFWAVTTHEDLVWLCKHPETFENAPLSFIAPKDQFGEGEDLNDLAHELLQMDPPEHREYRSITSSFFTPRAIETMRPQVVRCVEEILDRLGELSGRPFDFVEHVASVMPIVVIADMLGLPQSDRKQFFRWTNEIVAPDEPEFQREPGVSPFAVALAELMAYFAEMVAYRRKRPTSDITSVIANATVQGGPVPDLELLSYLALLIVAGNETTRNAISGGLIAMLDNPAEWERLKENPDLIKPACEEIVRFTSPLIQFARTPNRDVEVHGHLISAGETMAVFYPAANRDPAVFDKPDRFRIDRSPNRHVGFGIGEHVCLGAHLARMELQELFGALSYRMKDAEIVAAVERSTSSFIGGVKRLPVVVEMEPKH